MTTILIIVLILIITSVFIFYLRNKHKQTIKLTTDEYNLLSKRKFDRYELRSFLVRGDFNSTFTAYDPEKKKNVIIRILNQSLSYKESVVKQFQLKGEMLKFLAERFPGTDFVQNISHGTAYIDNEPRPYIVTDYITGVSLWEVLEKFGILSPRDTINIIKQLARIFSLVHIHRIWIRDASPVNILIGSNGSGYPVVTLANIGVPYKDLPSDEAIRFKTPYYSPEDRKGGPVDEKSDIYTLAALMFRMLKGYDPPENITDETFSGVIEVLKTSLADDPSIRPRSVEDFIKIVEANENYKSSVKNQRWSVAIPNLLKGHAEVKVKHGGREVTARIPKKKQLLPPNTALKVKRFLPFGIASAIILFFGRKIESVLASPKKAIKAGVGGIVVITLAVWYFVCSAPSTIITINTEPAGAIVYINDVQVGKPTPLKKHGIDSGSISIKIKKEGYFTKDTAIIAQEGESYEFAFGLDSAANLTINVNPPDAIVLVDRDTVPTHKLQSYEATIGKHTISVFREGYQVESREVTLKKGKNNLQFSIEAAGSLTINSEPDSAVIIIDDKERGITPKTFNQITASWHKLMLRKDGYNDLDTPFALAQKQVLTLNLNMVPQSGWIKIRVIPKGTIYIDDTLKKSETEVVYIDTISIGHHKVTIEHPNFGKWEKDIKIEHNKFNKPVIDFYKEYSVNIAAFDDANQDVKAEILVDGQVIKKKYTPTEIKVRCGLHKIDVRAKNYLNVGGPIVLNIEQDITKPLRFNLKKE